MAKNNSRDEKRADWQLESLKIEFKKGYEFKKDPVDKVDRYEGKIEFKNGLDESFSFLVEADMCNRYIDVIAEDIVKAASELGDRLIVSLKLNDRKE